MKPGDIIRGTIVCVQVADPNGRNVKRRPLVAVTPPGPKPDYPCVGVCVTGTFCPSPDFIELPWRDDGHPATGLMRPSAAHCGWVRQFDIHDVEDILGYAPESFLDRILQRVRALNPALLGDRLAIKPAPRAH